MSKADEMGESSAFNRAGSARSARGRAIRSALDSTDPTQLALHYLAHNPDNPRETLGDVTQLAGSLRDHGQKQPLGIMTRDAYLAANPGREDELDPPEAMYVVIDGNRRLAAAHEAGLSSLKVMVDNSATDTNELLESALVANIHREAFEPMDEAKALKQLLEIHGTQDKLAKRLHRSQGWVSQRLALLSLTPELKKDLEEGSESVDLLRRVGKKPPAQQKKALEKLKTQQAAAASKTRRRAEPDPPPPPRDPAPPSESMPTQRDGGSPTSGKGDPPAEEPGPGADRGSGDLHYGVMNQDGGDEGEAAPPAAVVMPWDNPTAILRILREYMQPADLEQLVKEAAEAI